MGMVRALVLYLDGEGAPEERLRLAEPIGFPQASGEVAEGVRDVGIVRAVVLYLNGEGAPEERLRLAEPVGDHQQCGEVVEAHGDIRMLWA
jgi:anti-sigma factor RsiW